MNESRRTYEWVTSHIWMSHDTHMNESCHNVNEKMCTKLRHQTAPPPPSPRALLPFPPQVHPLPPPPDFVLLPDHVPPPLWTCRNSRKSALQLVDVVNWVAIYVVTTQYTVHSTQYTVVWCVVNWLAIDILSTQYTVHSTQYTVHSTHYTVVWCVVNWVAIDILSTQYTIHSTQYTVHTTQLNSMVNWVAIYILTTHSTQYTVHTTQLGDVW